MAELTCPYVGLAPYTETEARFFFGRERETRLIIDRLHAAPLTLLCGASGVGKSSVLRAGVHAALMGGAAETGRSAQVAVYLDDWQGDVLRRLREAVRRAIADMLPGAEILPADEAVSLADWLRSVALRHRIELVVLLDQFEEFFVYHGGPEKAVRNPLWRQLTEAVHRPDLPASFLVAIREDALARLDCLEQLIPDPLSNCLRLRPLDEKAAREAVVQPVRAHNASPPDERRYGDVEIEPSFVDEVIGQLRRIRPAVGDGGKGRSQEGQEGVQPSDLQRVMATIWHHEVETGSRTLWTQTLGDLGGASAIVREHFDQAMTDFDADEREICARLFQFLVTPSGARRAYSAADLAGYTDVPAQQLEALLARLTDSEARILTALSPRSSADEVRYEISHDGLGPAILRWRQRYHEAKTRHEFAAEAERQRTLLERERRAAGCLRWLLAGLTVVTIAVVTAMLLAWLRIEKARGSGGTVAGEELELRQLIEERDQALADAARLEEQLNEAKGRIPRLRSMIGTHAQQLQQLEQERDAAYAEAASLEEQLIEASASATAVKKVLEDLRSALGIEEVNEEDPRVLVQERLQQIESRNDLLFGQLAAAQASREEGEESSAPAERPEIAQIEVGELRSYLDRDPYGSFAGLAERRIRSSEGMALILKAVEHLGGSEVVDGIQSIDSRARGLYFGSQRDATARLLVTFFDLLYLELATPTTHAIRVVNSGEGFSELNGVVQEASPAELRKQMMPLTENPLAVLRKRADEGFFATAVERSEIAGQAVELVEVEIEGGMYRLGVDSETGRIRSLSFTGEDEEGNPGEYQKIYSDHRMADMADGEVEMPFATVIYFDGERMFDLTFEVIKLDGLLDMKPLEAIEEGWEQ